MKRLLMILPLLFIAGGTAAMERHNMSEMTCEQVKSMLQSERKALLASPAKKPVGMMKYDMYVPSRTSCGAGGAQNWAQTARIKTSDGTCVVYRCVTITRSTPRY